MPVVVCLPLPPILAFRPPALPIVLSGTTQTSIDHLPKVGFCPASPRRFPNPYTLSLARRWRPLACADAGVLEA